MRMELNEDTIVINYEDNIKVEIKIVPTDYGYHEISVSNGEVIKSWIGEEKVEYKDYIHTNYLDNFYIDLTKNVDDMSNSPLRSCIHSIKNYMCFVPFAEQVTTILNATLTDDELAINEDWRQYFMEVETVKRGIFYKSQFKSHNTYYKVVDEDWEKLRCVTQWFIQEWLRYSTHIPYNEVVHSNWNYEKYGDDWREKLGVKE